jgi:FMN-dependent NADH-azoreductase
MHDSVGHGSLGFSGIHAPCDRRTHRSIPRSEVLMKLLHIVATPRSDSSTTLPIAQALLDELAERDADLVVETLDLFTADLPALAGSNIDAKYTLLRGSPVDAAHAASWARIEDEIARFLAADAVVITAPMWNFGIPYTLKYYIDCIVQPGYLFRFGEGGMPHPLVEGKRMVVVTTSGSDYSVASPLHALDFHEQYLRAIFAFVGVTDITFIHGHGVDVPGGRDAGVEHALEHARAVAADERWPQLDPMAA